MSQAIKQSCKIANDDCCDLSGFPEQIASDNQQREQQNDFQEETGQHSLAHNHAVYITIATVNT
jgi:hypothetical protein